MQLKEVLKLEIGDTIYRQVGGSTEMACKIIGLNQYAEELWTLCVARGRHPQIFHSRFTEFCSSNWKVGETPANELAAELRDTVELLEKYFAVHHKGGDHDNEK